MSWRGAWLIRRACRCGWELVRALPARASSSPSLLPLKPKAVSERCRSELKPVVKWSSPFLQEFWDVDCSKFFEFMVEREARPVEVYSLKQVDPPPPLPKIALNVRCGGGFYVRTLIEDLSKAVGSRGHMTSLERTKQGPFELQHALREEDWNYERLCRHIQEARVFLPLPNLSKNKTTENAADPGHAEALQPIREPVTANRE